uniref:Synaptobrevin, longin-like domain protein n=1 Tax=Tanacetum cinerariifolium TaxID=118510 RepID=A0A6L2K1E3_TANCI|nr:hypothetical protein [Tanacetum cinerariifolium]
MALTFADTHNMIAYLTKSDVSEGFDQIIDFLNASSIKYALTVNPNIYVSCIKQFGSSVSVKKVNDVTRLQALVDRKKVIITETVIQEALRLDDAESMDYLPNEEIFTELSRMRYEKPSTKLTFYKAFFSPQWKFLIHTILQCMSTKMTSWNEFSSSMASAVICLLTSRKFNFSKYIFESLVRNVDSSIKFYMYQRFLQLMIRAQVGDLSLHSTKYSSPALTQKQDDDVAAEGAASVDVDDVPAAVDKPSIPLPTPTTQPPPPPLQDLPSTSQVLPTPPPSPIGGIVANIDADEDVTLKDVAAVAKDVATVEKDAEIEENADDDELEPIELKEVVEVVTTAKLMTEVVTTASATITDATTLITAFTITTTPSAARRRKRVVIRDPEETATPSIIIHSEPKSKDKGKGIVVEEPKPLKKQAQIEQDKAYARKNMAGFKMDYFKGISYDDIRPIFKKKFNSNVAFLEKTREQMEEKDNKALKRASKSQAEKATKKVPVVDSEIYTENNKPYYKIIRADGSPQLFLSFLILLRNFDIEDLEVLWQLVKERFESSKPKNFSDDFLLTTLTYMFEKPNVQAQEWKNQRTVHGLVKVKSWRLLESCGDTSSHLQLHR